MSYLHISQMSDIKRINQNECVTVQGQYAVINEGTGYAIVNIQTQQILARNISSFLDCVKTLEYIVGKGESQNRSQSPIPASPSQHHPKPEPVQEQITSTPINHTQKKLDELDLALLRSLVSYFDEMADKIRHYHKDHHASQEEAEVIANYYLKTASMVSRITNQQDLKGFLKHLEALKEKIGRYQHDNYKYRWSTGLEKVMMKLKKILP